MDLRIKLLYCLLSISTGVIVLDSETGEFREKIHTDANSLRLYYGRLWTTKLPEEPNDTKDGPTEEKSTKKVEDPTRLLRWEETEQDDFDEWLESVKIDGIQCPDNFPFAFNNGTDCCFSKLEDKDKTQTKDKKNKFRNLCDGKSLFWTSNCCMNNHTASAHGTSTGRVQ